MTVTNACTTCTRLDPEAQPIEGEGEHRGRCEAFPDGIPEDIWYGDHAHRAPFEDEDLLWDGDEADHATYVDLFEMMTGELPDGLPNPG